MKTHFVLAFGAVVAFSGLQAAEETVRFAGDGSGDPAVDLVPGPASLFFSGGYASSYLFRGVDLGDNWVEGRLELAVPIAETATLNFGGKYGSADGYREAQAFASVQQSLGPVHAALGYRWYGEDADRQEVGVMLGTLWWKVDWSVSYFYDTELEGHYFELAGQHTWQILDHLALKSSAGLSAASEYWYDESGLNHAQIRVDLPITVREWMTFTPWVGASFPLEALDAWEDDAVAGGLNVQFAF